MIRKTLLSICVLVLSLCASAYEQSIKNIAIEVNLNKDGSADVSEFWDVSVAKGTEWYLVRENLGPIVISDLAVHDLTTKMDFVNIGEWDSKPGIEEKKNRCGILHKSNGVELCWGIGSYGNHEFYVTYKMSNVVEALEDCDIFHLQLVSPGLSSRPKEVYVKIGSNDVQIDTTNTSGWGFGFKGGSMFDDGAYHLVSTQEFEDDDSVIALMRFDKGMFNPQASREGVEFIDVYERAMIGADFTPDSSSYYDDDEEDEPWWKGALGFLAVGAGIYFYFEHSIQKDEKKVLGCKLKDVEWYRDIPMAGDLYKSRYILTKLLEPEYLPAALIMRMIYQNALRVGKNADGYIEITFNDSLKGTLDPLAAQLYDMMQEASGHDRLLSDREFSEWTKTHMVTVITWDRSAYTAGAKSLTSQEEARKLMGFKKYLQEFTLSNEREVQEVKLWREMLVFGALFGVAERVVDQLRDINPKMVQQFNLEDWSSVNHVLGIASSVSRTMNNRVSEARAAASHSGYGGHGGSTSRGGGGGHRSGGRGGGSR